MKKTFLLGLILLICTSIIWSMVYFVGGVNNARAAAPGDIDQVDLHIKTEGSLDQVNWFNFSGTEESENDTLNVNPGDSIFYRIKIWNDGTRNADNVDVEGTISNNAYVAGWSCDGDADIDGNGFDGFTYQAGGIGTINEIVIGGSENAGFQMIAGDLLLRDDIPAGQTIMLGNVKILDYDPEIIVQNATSRFAKILGFKKAQAEGVDRESAIRIVVNVAGGGSRRVAEVTPTPTPSPTAQQAAETIELPQTGADLLN